MNPPIRSLFLLAGLVLVTPLVSGCFLQAFLGRIIGEEEGASGEIKANSITADCSIFGADGEFGCLYHMEYEGIGFELFTTGELISEFGLFGVLIDPVIVQVPEDVSDVSGTFNDASTAASLPLVITETWSFKVEPGVEANAEPGQKFLILEFPDGTTYEDVQFDFELTFHYPVVEPVDFKAIFAGRVEAGGQTFYIPLLPCTSDFSEVPEFTIPVADTPPGPDSKSVHIRLQQRGHRLRRSGIRLHGGRAAAYTFADSRSATRRSLGRRRLRP